MIITLSQLEYLCAVARTGNYSRAAEESGVSQPVVHRSIKDMEKACGIKLFERLGKRTCLTERGRAIFDYASQIIYLASQAEQALAEDKGSAPRKISIGCSITALASLLPAILAKWMPQHPEVDMSIVQGRPEEIQKLLLEDRLDLLLGSETRWAPGLHSRPIFSDVLLVVVGPNHPLAGRGPLSIAELSGHRLIAPSAGSPTRSEIEHIESQYGVQFRIAIEVDRPETRRELCRTGLGVAILPRSSIIDDVAHGRLKLVDVEGFPRSRTYFLVHRANRTLSREIQSLISAAELWVRESQQRAHPYKLRAKRPRLAQKSESPTT